MNYYRPSSMSSSEKTIENTDIQMTIDNSLNNIDYYVLGFIYANMKLKQIKNIEIENSLSQFSIPRHITKDSIKKLIDLQYLIITKSGLICLKE